MKVRVFSAAMLMAVSAGAFAKAPVTFSELDAWQSGKATRIAQMSTAEMDETEGNAVPLVIIGVGLAAGTLAGGAGYVLNTDNPTLGGVAWHAGLGLTAATVGTVVVPTLPVTGAIAGTLAAPLIPLLPYPGNGQGGNPMPGNMFCSIFGTCGS